MSTGTTPPAETTAENDARHLMWRIASDLRTLRAVHGMITPEMEERATGDLLQWVLGGFARSIEFTFYETDTGLRRFAVRYDIDRAWTGDDSDSGRLGRIELVGTSFDYMVYTTPGWAALSDSERTEFYGVLSQPWGSVERKLVDGNGSWTPDRSYGSNSVGATRHVFRGTR